MLAAVLSSLQTFLRYATRAEGHRFALRYETLRRDMATTLALPPEDRGAPDRSLDSVRQRMDRYAKQSPTIGERTWEKQSGRKTANKFLAGWDFDEYVETYRSGGDEPIDVSEPEPAVEV